MADIGTASSSFDGVNTSLASSNQNSGGSIILDDPLVSLITTIDNTTDQKDLKMIQAYRVQTDESFAPTTPPLPGLKTVGPVGGVRG